MKLSNAEKMYNADASAIHIAGIPSTVLMKNAAGHVARAALELMGSNRSAAVFCGSGNNGGDGVAAAAILLRYGVKVEAYLVGRRERMTADTASMEEWLRHEGGELKDYDPNDPETEKFLQNCGVIIDAIFGIGLHRELSGTPLRAVRQMNASPAPKVAADIPSGVQADTGAILGDAVRCAATVTFSRAKPGHYLEPGCTCCGKVEVCSIGIPEEYLRASETDIEAVLPGDLSLPRRDPLTHKGSFGKILLVGGSIGYSGAPNLASLACVRSGAGLVWLGVPEPLWPVCAVKNAEAMPFPLPADEEGRLAAGALDTLRERWKNATVLAIGPGLGRGAGTREIVRTAVKEYSGILLLDADALWAISDDMPLLRAAAGTVIVTPHAGEFARMQGDLTGDRLCDASVFARKYNCITVLKGHRTVIALPNGRAFILCAGNAGMARGGSGDVLTGVIAAMCGQFPPEQAVVLGAWIHAAAGDVCAEEIGEYGMTPSDIISRLPAVMKSLTR